MMVTLDIIMYGSDRLNNYVHGYNNSTGPQKKDLQKYPKLIQ